MMIIYLFTLDIFDLKANARIIVLADVHQAKILFNQIINHCMHFDYAGYAIVALVGTRVSGGLVPPLHYTNNLISG